MQEYTCMKKNMHLGMHFSFQWSNIFTSLCIPLLKLIVLTFYPTGAKFFVKSFKYRPQVIDIPIITDSKKTAYNLKDMSITIVSKKYNVLSN